MALSLDQEIGSIKNKVARTKEKFERFITNKETPLEKRWEFFGKTPEYFKNHKSYVEDFKSISDKGISFYSEFGIDRYTTVETHSFVENILENVDFCKDSNSKSDKEYLEKWTEERINRLKEEILEKNLGSFCNDW